MSERKTDHRLWEGVVVENVQLNDEIWRAKLELPAAFGPARPGQFVQLQCPPLDAFGLWRPFSISRAVSVDRSAVIEIVYGVVGLRTRGLASARPSDRLQLLGPLGTWFRPVPGKHLVLIGGGRGIAPIIGLAEHWSAAGLAGEILYGARSKAQLIPLDGAPWPLALATEDGSAGLKGRVIELLEMQLRERGLSTGSISLHACGPNRMLHALSEWARERAVPIETSLETHFGCGIGICAGCAVPVVPEGAAADDAFFRYRFACLEGPVMNGCQIDWPGVAE